MSACRRSSASARTRADGAAEGRGSRLRDLAEHDAAVRSRLLNQAARLQRGGDVGGPGEHAVGADHCPDVGRARHAVLERQDERLRADQRREERKRGVVVVGLHRVQHHVHGPDLDGIGARAWPHDQVPEWAPHPQPARSDRVQVRATRHQRHIESGPGQPCGVVPTDRPCTHDRELHVGHRMGILDRTQKCRDAGMPRCPMRKAGRVPRTRRVGRFLATTRPALFAHRPPRRSDNRCDPSTRGCTTATPPIVATDSRDGR